MAEAFRLPTLKLDSGRTMTDVSVAWSSWGELNAQGDNAIVVCHALTGSPAADDWWAPLIGPDRTLDTNRFFVVCLNVLGSPYGSASPVSNNPETGEPYGSGFPAVTIRDTVRAHRQVLEEALGVRRVLFALGGSMGGMQSLEWAFEDDFVDGIVPIGVGGRHSAWCIGFSEAQRQAIYADPVWNDGQYTEQPGQGLATARMIAMLTYRSSGSLTRRFGRKLQDGAEDMFAVESYLGYQGAKLVDRFDANCYVHLTRQMDTHDIARGRGAYEDVLRNIEKKTLVIGVDSDILYPLAEQEELASLIPGARLEVIRSPDGHDAFLIEFEQLGRFVRTWMEQELRSPEPPGVCAVRSEKFIGV